MPYCHAIRNIRLILEIFKTLNNKRSSGYDGLTTQLFKVLSESLAIPGPITFLNNRYITEGCVPNCMKIAKVLPLYKNKEKKLMTNYRPISLLPALSIKSIRESNTQEII